MSYVAFMIWHIKDLYYMLCCYAETDMSESFKNAQTIFIAPFTIDDQLFFYKDLIKYRPFCTLLEPN